MGVITSEVETATAIPPTKMFKAFVLAAKALPQAISCIITLEGDGGPGTIKQISFGNGDALINRFEKISNMYKFEPYLDGGSICKNSKKFYTVGDIEIKEEVIEARNEMAMTLFKAIETYLLANPEA